MRKLNKLIRNENGSITMFVTLSVLFLIFVLVGIYANYANKLKAQEEQIGKIQGNYGEHASEEGMDKLYIAQTRPEQDAGQGNIGKLPTEYQQVEYIQSTGTQYIDTNYICSSDTSPNKIEAEFQFMQQGTGTNFVFGTCESTSNYQPLLFGTDANKNSWMFAHFGSGGLTKSGVRFGTFDTNKHKVKYVFGEGIYLDDSLQTDTVEQASTLSNSKVSLALFARQRGPSTIDGYSFIRMYSFKIYENDTLKRDFIPCYRKSDNVAGMYDVVNCVFYTNAGTGTFIKGEDW